MVTTKTALCPGCSGPSVLTDDPQVHRCEECGGVFSLRKEPITLEQVMKFVNPHVMRANPAVENEIFYFDFVVLGPAGTPPYRTHGWACSNTKQVVQFG